MERFRVFQYRCIQCLWNCLDLACRTHQPVMKFMSQSFTFFEVARKFLEKTFGMKIELIRAS